jgi:hypothetical protein
MTTCVPNTIKITTYGVDLWHHRLRLAKRNPKSVIEPPQGERGGGGKKERGKKRAQGILPGHSCQMNWCD